MKISAIPVALTAMLLVGACTGGSTVEGADTPSSSETTATTAVVTTVPEASTTTEPTRPTPPESMPGDVIDFGPRAGDQVAVVGVPQDDVLNVRIAPGTEFDVIANLDPGADDVIAMGENRLLTSSFWLEIETPDGPGWVNEAFIGFIGVTQILDSDLASESEGAEGLGMLVAQSYSADEPPSRITLQASDGDIVTYDVLGIQDDAVKGYRLTVETAPTGDGREVVSIVETTICSRGIDAERRCF